MKKIISLFLFIYMNGFILLQADELKLTAVTENVWAIVGPLSNRSPENRGNNATFGFVVTPEGTVLIDSGGSYLGAQKIHEIIKSVTDKPVKYVINSGGQDHRWFGNDYFSALGATIISSKKAREDQENRQIDQIGRLVSLIGEDNFANTREKFADETFDQDLTLTVGGVKFEIRHAGQAHTPGDAFIWLPDQSVMFTGDIVYLERMLGIGEQSGSKSWLRVFEVMASYRPNHVIPGHGNPATLKKAEKETYRYLKILREKVADFIEQDGDASDISQLDMSEYQYLHNYESLSGRNALKVYTEMEWE